MKQPGVQISRRALISGLVFAGGAGVVGVTLGYRYKDKYQIVQPMNRRGLSEFLKECDAIHERHRLQTVAMVQALKKKYEDPVFGRIRVWDLIVRMHQVQDASDSGLLGMSQFGHVAQVLEAMESAGVQDPNMILMALLHDAGKTILLAGEVPENVVCNVKRLGEAQEKAGLDQVVYQFGHSEFIYSRLKDHVPPELSWAARYHSIELRDAARFMSDVERERTARFLKPFRRFDSGFKSPYRWPALKLEKYRDLIEQTFPNPILI